MRILLTGAAGKVGGHTLKYLLSRNHQVIAVDVIPTPIPELTTSSTSSLPTPPPSASTSSLSNGLKSSTPAPAPVSKSDTFTSNSMTRTITSTITSEPTILDQLTIVQCDLTDHMVVEKLFEDHMPLDGVIHFGAIPAPGHHDDRVVHNTNVTSSYNVLQTAASKGIKRIVQASSVNAIGLSFGPEGHKRFAKIPITEKEPMTVEDPYAISKAVCELQAEALCRYYPGLRVASLRFHMCEPDYDTATQNSKAKDLFAWTSLDACASAALLGLTSEGWEGAEAFNIIAPDHCFEGVKGERGSGAGSIDVLKEHWDGRYAEVDHEWFETHHHRRRSHWDSTKAERLLGWDHDGASAKA